ncbi:MAG: hypothetical protein D6712_16100 [Chloroflexi bacterium]|nr:MAG: hypothetical protein D6712_16100 [Chloroflexota bacterium]
MNYSDEIRTGLAHVAELGDTMIEKVLHNVAEIRKQKVVPRVLKAQIARMLDVSQTTIGNTTKALGIESKARVGLELEEVRRVREHLKKPVTNTDRAAIWAVQTQKGGTGKTTTVVCLAHALACQGAKVLLIDMDFQATATTICGFLPDVRNKSVGGITADETSLAVLYGKSTGEEGWPKDFKSVIKPSAFPLVDVIPNCPSAERLVFDITGISDPVELRSQLLREVGEEYDFILIDSPPSLGFVSSVVTLTADAILVPTPPKVFDMASTISYAKLLLSIHELRNKEADGDSGFSCVRFLPTLVSPRLKLHQMMINDVYPALFYIRPSGSFGITETVIYDLADVQAAMSDFKTVFEISVRNKMATDQYENLANEVITLTNKLLR